MYGQVLRFSHFINSSFRFLISKQATSITTYHSRNQPKKLHTFAYSPGIKLYVLTL